MQAAVIVFPGSNRDRDMIAALTKLSGRAPAIVWHKDASLPAADLYVIPGGFSYGDYLRAGAHRGAVAGDGSACGPRRAGRPYPRRLQRLPNPHRGPACCRAS